MENDTILMDEVNVPETYSFGPGSPGFACGADCTGLVCAVGGGDACGGACNGLICGGEC